MYRIGEFSKMNRITVKALRHYDEIGLLKPDYVDEATGYRYYSSGQLPALHKIMALKRIGFSLNEIIAAMDRATTVEAMIHYLKSKQQTTERQIAEEKAKLAQIDSYISMLQKEGFLMKYNIVIKELPEVTVASMRRVIPDYGAFNSFYPEMGRAMQEQNLKCAVPEYCFSIYHDGEYRETDIDVEICQAVVAAGRDTETMKFKKINPVKTAACVLHKGPYSTIGNAYAALMEWISDNNCEVISPPRESYIDGIWNKQDPEEWLTEIQIPVSCK